MNNFKKYIFEYLLILFVVLLTITGFWKIYFGVDAHPTPYQNFHVVTNLIWLFLLLYQLSLIGKKQYSIHRKIGLSILFFGPWLFASTALLSVYSAHKGVVSGQGDILIVQNVTTTLELGFIILMAFILKKRRKLHGAFILSTAILFMGIALFFTLISFVPQFKIEGPETFYRFETAGTTSRCISLFIGLLFFLKDRRNGWPMLLVGSFLTLNNYINILLIKYNFIQPLTEFVGSFNQLITFLGSFIVLLFLLIFTAMPNKRPVANLGRHT
ncbi:MAG TPA: hypothetical protein VGP43_11425 [Chitinophagaceae bacterium]|nr:hypothetical protein [Chitinophagaceae bacterium]